MGAFRVHRRFFEKESFKVVNLDDLRGCVKGYLEAVRTIAPCLGKTIDEIKADANVATINQILEHEVTEEELTTLGSYAELANQIRYENGNDIVINIIGGVMRFVKKHDLKNYDEDFLKCVCDNLYNHTVREQEVDLKFLKDIMVAKALERDESAQGETDKVKTKQERVLIRGKKGLQPYKFDYI